MLLGEKKQKTKYNIICSSVQMPFKVKVWTTGVKRENKKNISYLENKKSFVTNELTHQTLVCIPILLFCCECGTVASTWEISGCVRSRHLGRNVAFYFSSYSYFFLSFFLNFLLNHSCKTGQNKTENQWLKLTDLHLHLIHRSMNTVLASNIQTSWFCFYFSTRRRKKILCFYAKWHLTC